LTIIRYYTAQFKALGVKTELNKEATTDLVKKMAPDVIIIACGSDTYFPPIPGINNSIVVDARKVIEGTAKVGDKIVIIGGGEVGIETAELLSDQGRNVTLVEMLPKIGEQMVTEALAFISQKFTEHKVQIMTSAQVKEINSNGILVLDEKNTKRTIKADTVIIATGAKPNTKVMEDLRGLAREVYLSGDCLVPGNIMLAIHQGSMIGRMLF
jgi:pyruvate/2-oxoglutarate dehydrogenase complex dihydrolipoamide dehydrogenase (E3) component